jgi:hypothetical protein
MAMANGRSKKKSEKKVGEVDPKGLAQQLSEARRHLGGVIECLRQMSQKIDEVDTYAQRLNVSAQDRSGIEKCTGDVRWERTAALAAALNALDACSSAEIELFRKIDDATRAA